MPILTPQERLGTTVGAKYRLEKILGVGGMGSVFAGTHAITGRRVAVKILHPEHAGSADVIERFFREARTASDIRHPNVVDVLDMGTDEADKTVYLVLELLEGESLARRLKRDKKLSYAESAAVLLPVMRALAFAHGRRVVHRDLKPDNIFVSLDPSGGTVVKLLDFGIAKALDRNESRMTQTGFVLGTPAYMSPEQAAGMPDDITTASDTWSMGVVWYECLTGEMPFEGASPTATLIAIANGRYHHLRRRMPELPLAIAHAVDKALVKDPARRHADMDAFIHAIQRGLEHPEERAAEMSLSQGPVPAPQGDTWSFGASLVPASATVKGFREAPEVPSAPVSEGPRPTPPSIVLDVRRPISRWGLLAGHRAPCTPTVPSVHAQRAVVTQRKASCVPRGVELETPLVYLSPQEREGVGRVALKERPGRVVPAVLQGLEQLGRDAAQVTTRTFDDQSEHTAHGRHS